MRAPDIIVLEEMMDQDGPINGGATNGAPTFDALVDAILVAGGPAYSYTQIDPLNNQDGGIPGGNIRVGFLYNPARVGFAPIPGGNATTPNSVTCVGGAPGLALNPGRVDPLNSAFAGSRKPLAGAFTYGGETIFVVGVHFTSKGGDDPLFGDLDMNTLYGDEGDDLLDGGGSDDVLVGGAGHDTLLGGLAQENLYGEAGNDTLDGGGSKQDFCDGGPGANTLSACELP